ncbi:MAG TPA: hypothetical protein VKB38_13255 [Terracidiphilus sp.]|nr:hypothetical protein [Terracidiphilus sp.]
MIFSEAKTYLCNKLNTSLTDIAAGSNNLFALQDITDYLNLGLKRAWDYKPWTFTEKTYKFTITSQILSAGYLDYPNTFEDFSAYRLLIEGFAEFEKKLFADYQKWLTDYPTDQAKIWSENERFIFVNTNAVSLNQIADITGKRRAPTLVNDTDLLPFSPTDDNDENSGNMAIVLLGYADALNSEKKKDPNTAKLVEAQAFSILDNVWKPMGERKAQQQQQNRPFFNTQNFFPNGRAGRGTNIGNFP